METLLVDKAVAEKFLPQIATRLWEKHVELRADEDSVKLLDAIRNTQHAAKIRRATEQDFYTEYNLSLIHI